jgi:hypothetical protein
VQAGIQVREGLGVPRGHLAEAVGGLVIDLHVTGAVATDHQHLVAIPDTLVAQGQHRRIPAVMHHAAGGSRPMPGGRIELVARDGFGVGSVAATADNQQLSIRQERVPATQHRVAQGGIRRQVRLIQRIFEGCRRWIVGVPQQRGFIRGDEQHLAGVEHGRMDDPVVPAWPTMRDVLGKDRPAAVEAIAERLQQGLEVLSCEGLEVKELLHVRKPSGNSRSRDSKISVAMSGSRILLRSTTRRTWPVFVVVVVGMVHLGIGWGQLLEHQVLRLKGLIQKTEDSPMKGRIQSDPCFDSILLGSSFLESHPCPLHHPATRHRPDGPDGVPNPSWAVLSTRRKLGQAAHRVRPPTGSCHPSKTPGTGIPFRAHADKVLKANPCEAEGRSFGRQNGSRMPAR